MRDVLLMQRLDGSSSSLGASPKSSSGYLHSNSLSSDVEDLQSPSSANGSLTHLEVGHSHGIPQVPIRRSATADLRDLREMGVLQSSRWSIHVAAACAESGDL